MLRAVIADDERRIIELIRQLVNWDELGIEVVGEVCDGVEALKLVRELTPDILITDIRMPGLDGLELVREISKRELDVSTVIISGHKQFDYACSALKYGVEDFLVKPIRREEINNILRSIAEKKRLREEGEQTIRRMTQRLEETSNRMRQTFLHECVRGQVHSGTPEEIGHSYDFRFGAGSYVAMLLTVSLPNAGAEEYAVIFEKLVRGVYASLDEKTDELEACTGDAGVLCIAYSENAEAPDMQRYLSGCFERLCMEVEIYGEIAFAAGISHVFSGPDRLTDAVAEAVRAARCKSILGNGRVICAEYIGPQEPVQLPRTHSEELGKIIERFAANELPEWLRRTLAGMQIDAECTPYAALMLGDAVCDRFWQCCETYEITVEPEQRRKLSYVLECTVGLESYFDTLGEELGKILTRCREEKALRENYPVRCAKQYMEKHLGEAISLDDIAAAAALSSSYLSSMFKRETGMNLSDYLQNLRIERAKELFRTTGKNLSEVADEVGYRDAKHFSKLFYRAVGVKPQEYRKLYAR